MRRRSGEDFLHGAFVFALFRSGGQGPTFGNVSDERNKKGTHGLKTPLLTLNNGVEMTASGSACFRAPRNRSVRAFTNEQLVAPPRGAGAPPRAYLVRYHGVFGPASRWRGEVIPKLWEPAQLPTCPESHSSSSHADARP